MAIELQVTSVTALVTSEPRERQIYDGRGDDRRVKGRFVDGAGAAHPDPVTGGDYAASRATVTGERISPLGQWTEWIASAAGRTGKPSETRAA